MSDPSDADAMASRVESSAPVGRFRRRDRGRGRSEPSPIVPERRAVSPDVSYSREVAKEAVSAVVSELRNHLFALFDDLRSSFNSAIALSKVPTDEERQMKGELPCFKATGIRDDAPAAAIPLGQSMADVNSDSESVRSHGRPKSVPEPSRTSLTHASTLGKAFRIDDWIESLTTDNPSGTPPVTVNSLPYNTLQQFGPWLKIEPFDGDPRRWETFIGSFKALVHDVVQSDAQRIAILSQLLSPRLRAALGSCLYSPETYSAALANLRRLFGDPSRALNMHIHDLMNISPMKNNSEGEVERIFYAIRGAVSTFRALGGEDELRSKSILHFVLMKLSYRLKAAWGRKVFELLPREASLVDLDQWLEEMVIVQNSIVCNESDPSERKGRVGRPNSSRRVNVLTSLNGVVACRVCDKTHAMEECPDFLSLSPRCRAETLKGFGLCFACFDSSHKARRCRVRKECGVDGCRLRHHPLLHGAPRVYVQDCTLGARELATKRTPSSESTMVGTTVTNSASAVLLSVVPVTAVSGSRVVSTYALLDTGSEGSLITERLAEKLQLNKIPSRIRLSTFHGQDPSPELFTTTLEIRSVDSEGRFCVKNAIVVPSLNVSARVVDWPTMKNRLDYLNDLPLVRIDYGRIELLLGADNFEAIRPVEVRQPPRRDQPYGVRTPLGWTVCGRFSLPREERFLYSVHINRVSVASAENQTSLFESLERFWSTESFGTKPNTTLPVSAEEAYARRLLESSTMFVGNRFSVGLLWKPNVRALPNNRPLAVSRFLALRRRLRSRPALHAMYREAMDDLLHRNVAAEVPNADLELPHGRVWYLPHHGVTHPNKPSKLRIVFDASAKYANTSLNDLLSKGPDLANSVVGVLTRFRRYKIPVASDVEKMFHQVIVPEDDQSVLRFLWTNSTDGAPRTYQMKRQVFGLSSAPASCIHALNCTIKKFGTDEVVKRCRRQFYVDNYLDSFETVEDATRISSDLKEALRKGGFVLTKWSTTDRDLLECFPVTERSTGIVNLDLGCNTVENVLGLSWDQRSDSFRFAYGTKIKAVKTKRQLLSAVASLYDPLGLFAPVMVTAKSLMRDATCLDFDWDEELDSNLLQRFQAWSSGLGSLSGLSIPRWLSLSREVARIELHSFSDASEAAFGAVLYLRSVSTVGTVSVSFVMAKTRIAPRRPLTVPRLELQAALLAVRLVETVKREIDVPLDGTIYWTDSTTVLHWLRVPARMRSFVAHRIAEILELSEASDWRYVPGKLNPADDASRGLPANKLHADHRWFCGPAFLGELETAWPENITVGHPEHAELETFRPSRQIGAISTWEENVVLRLIDVTSSYKRILHIIAYVCRFVYHRRGTSRSLEADEIRMAERLCIRIVQNAYLGADIADMREGRKINESSKLIKLNAFLDRENLVRIGGRICRADVDYSIKHPVVLPGESSLAHRIVWQRHLDLMHAGIERVLADLRTEYWIIGGRRSVRRIIGRCLYCRRLSALPKQVMMADLPSERLDFCLPAFTNVGIDFFGPFAVTVKRSTEKRYGCIFTCLVSRAVHLELTPSLSLNSVVLALKRFISRRGRPKVIFSDNGKSFVRAAKCLEEELTNLDLEKLSASASDLRIHWKFSPPNGPHFGGVWERLIGMAKKALTATLQGNTCTDEVLSTVFAEVEALLNGRPLCYIGDDPSNPEPLTPFLLLTGRANVNVPLDITCVKDCTLSKHWCHAQLIVNRFWRRWLKEYLPTLQRRSKWTKDQANLEVGDVVVVVEPQLPRGQWPLGRVTEVVKGSDGRVRIATVRTKHRSYVRPVTRLALIEHLH